MQVIKSFQQCPHFVLILNKYINQQGPINQNFTKLLANVMLKFLSWNMANTLIFFGEKMCAAFALQKLLTFLQQKYQCIWNDALNNWAQRNNRCLNKKTPSKDPYQKKMQQDKG